MRSTDELVGAYAQAYESVGGHPNRSARALGIAAVIDLLAADVDLVRRGPFLPSTFSALLRDQADSIRRVHASAADLERD
jgi:hypothetical protein